MLLYYICTDGGARGNPGPAAIAYAILDAAQRVIEQGAQTIGRATNNEAEYRALHWGLERALILSRRKPGEPPPARVRCCLDSELVVRQLNLGYKVRNPRMKALHARVLETAVQFGPGVAEFHHLPRTDPLIRRADRLLNKALDREEKLHYNRKVGSGAGEPP